MKKLILALLIMVAGISFAQTKGLSVGAGTVWTDTLGYTNLSETSDSVLILDTRFSKDWYRIIMDGNTNAQADSVYYQHGTVRYSEANAAVDTMWGSWGTVKDSVWGSINVMVNNTVGKDFLIFSPIHQLLRFTLFNYRAAIPGRNCVITIQAVKK